MIGNLQVAATDSYVHAHSVAVLMDDSMCSRLTHVHAWEVASLRRYVAGSLELANCSVQRAFGACRVSISRITEVFKAPVSQPVASQGTVEPCLAPSAILVPDADSMGISSVPTRIGDVETQDASDAVNSTVPPSPSSSGASDLFKSVNNKLWFCRGPVGVLKGPVS